MKKTKILISGINLDILEKSGKFPCGVYLKGVRVNSILCSTCNLWIRKKYSGITRRITKNRLFVCFQCQGSAQPIDGRPSTTVLVDGINVEPLSVILVICQALVVDANKLSSLVVVWRGVNSESCYPYLPKQFVISC